MRMKRFTAAMITLGVCLSMGISAGAMELSQEMEERVSQGVDAANELFDSFSRSREDEIIYPDNYAGVYFDDEMKLHVCFTDLEAAGHVASYFADTDVVYEQRRYSMQYLTEIKDDIKDEVPFQCIGVNATANQVLLDTNDPATEDMVEEILQSRYPYEPGYSPVKVKYEPGGGFQTLLAYDEPVEPENDTNDARASYDAIGGMALKSKDGSRFTLGICGEYNGKPSFLTCGHSGVFPKDPVYRNSRLIGTGTKRHMGKQGDWAIVALDSAWNTTPSVYGKNGKIVEIERTKSAVENMPIGKYGSTTGYTTGTVIQVDTEGYEEDPALGTSVLIKQLVKIQGAEGIAKPGDSGGPVYWENNFYGNVVGIYLKDPSIMSYTPVPSGFTPCTTRD